MFGNIGIIRSFEDYHDRRLQYISKGINWLEGLNPWILFMWGGTLKHGGRRNKDHLWHSSGLHPIPCFKFGWGLCWGSQGSWRTGQHLRYRSNSQPKTPFPLPRALLLWCSHLQLPKSKSRVPPLPGGYSPWEHETSHPTDTNPVAPPTPPCL